MEISKLKELSLFESIMLFEEQLKSKNNIKFYERYKSYKIRKDDENYAQVNLKNWTLNLKRIY
jgi:cell division protein ZapA (FtsZ GTPase activity inhibitor)